MTVYHPNIKRGSCVYRHYAPQQLGVVETVWEADSPIGLGKDHYFDVWWVKTGVLEEKVQEMHLRPLDDLIADHEKKLKSHNLKKHEAEVAWQEKLDKEAGT